MNHFPTVEFNEDGEALGRWWSVEQDGRILCQLCPRACRLKSGDRGFCFVRANHDHQMVLDTYGRSTGFCIDPIEKKPLNHFFPGTPVLSFGTAGCNLGCKFCQNWDISKSREVARLSDQATPEAIAQAAKEHGCRSVAFTYNDPVIWAEYAIDTAAACRDQGIKSVAVTAGYITPQARGDFFAAMDAANIDLKAFTEDFYHRITGAHLDPILDTIRYVCRETECWVELTNLIIPDANDDQDQLRRMCDWVFETVGSDVPIHFTAFHPDFRMTDRSRTPEETLIRAYELARQAGLHYVYLGNVHDVVRQSTYCPGCGSLLIERDWHQLGRYALNNHRCQLCQYQIAGHFEAQPGNWGQRRQPIQISEPPPGVVVPTQESSMPQATPTEDLVFSDDQRARIHQAACRIVAAAATETSAAGVEELLGDLAQRPIAGIYVTLKRGETLRGCCGLQGPPIALAAALADAATRTTRFDPRMPPVAAVELKYLSLSVSILGSPRPIDARGDDRIEAIKVGQHGLRVQLGNSGGLLLPAVAKERNWNSRQFLDAVCRKAGLPPASWRRDEVAIHVFDGVDFGGRLADAIELTIDFEPGLIDQQQLERLRDWVRCNLVAIQTGATPVYYATDVMDGAVSGVVLQIVADPQQPAVGWMQLTLRDGVPLQSTLFQLTSSAAGSLGSHDTHANDWQVRLAVLSSVVHHGIDRDPDLDGFDCRGRAVLAMDGRRWSIGFDAHSQPEDLFRDTLAAQAFRSGSTQIYSAVCDSTAEQIFVSLGPRPQGSVTTRPPGVAGGFYPADDEQREQVVDELLANFADADRKSVAAAMVPHAGLRFSGRVAADVWRRIELPESVLIIGPKHTADGVDWAVAPHDWWQLSSTAGLPGAVDLAERIAAAVPGMELDAAAHRREHGIEVQLPLLYRLAPQTRVAAIAMQGGSFDELSAAAEAMASCISRLEKPPLLVISSDMNHFADDTENRRRDRLALRRSSRMTPKVCWKSVIKRTSACVASCPPHWCC